MSRDSVPAGAAPPANFDLLRLPLLGRFFRWQYASRTLRWITAAVVLLLIVEGFAGSQLSPKNVATVITWLHFRGLLVISLLVFGNAFCLACPFILVRDGARRLHAPTWLWPRALRSKWPAVIVFVLFLFAYELFDLWAKPWATAVVLLSYIAAATLLGVLFKGAAFCSSLCPLGQFNLVASLVSPFEVKIRDRAVCAACPTRDCIRGRGRLPGCEPGLFQPQKVGNLACHWRLDCLRACPYDNVGLFARLPGSELWLDPVRSVVGRFSHRPDLAALVVAFTFGALLNAFGMVSPVYTLELRLATALGTRSEALVLGLIFLSGIAVAPVLLLGVTGGLTRLLTGARDALPALVTRYAYALVPLGLGVWTAHFAFHFLTGLLTIIPVTQNLLVGWGIPLLGTPRWDLGPIIPSDWLFPLELGFLLLGWFGSLLVAFRIAERETPQRAWRAFLPWAGLLTLLLLAGGWLMSQPMEMRGTFLSLGG